MKRNPSRLVPLAVVAVLTLGACGSGDDDSAADTVPPAETSDGDSLIAPRPIEVGSGGGNAAGASTGAPEAASADRSMATDMIAPYQAFTFVAGEGLPGLPTNDVGYVFESGATVSSEQVAELAAALGVTGTPERIDDGYSVYWRVGPDDGTAASVYVYEDAQLSWSYSSAWADQTSVSSGCAVAEPAVAEPAVAPDQPVTDSEAVAPVDPPTTDLEKVEPPSETVTCETTPPPVGVPTADEAEARTRDLMAAVGLDPATFELETYADAWFANVNATEQLTDVFGGRTFSTGFGAEGVLQYASGQLAQPAAVGPYPLVDLDTAIARLNDPAGFYMGGYGGWAAADTAVAREAVGAPSVGVDVAEADVPESDVPESGAAVPPATEGSSAGSAGGGTDAVAPTPISEPVPVEIPTPEQVTVTLVDVQPDVWWVTDVDGTLWLLPAYRFIGDDGGWYTVPAVTVEYLVRVPVDSVPPATEPAPLPPETVPADTVADVTPLESSIGKTFAEFEADAAALGLTARIVEQDGVSLPATMDYNPSRVNVAVTGEGDAATVTAILNVG